MDEWSASGPTMRIDRHGSDWGHASLFVGGVFLVMSPMMLLFNIVMHVAGWNSLWMSDIRVARIVTPIIAVLFLSLIGFGAYAGFKGFGLARGRGEPIALPLAGLLCNAVNLLVWIGLSLNLMAILRMF